MVTCRFALTGLEGLDLEPGHPLSILDWKYQVCLCPHALFSLLGYLGFIGVSELFEDLITWINAPLCSTVANETLPLAYVQYSMTHHRQFITHNDAHVVFSSLSVSVTVPQIFDKKLWLEISCR